MTDGEKMHEYFKNFKVTPKSGDVVVYISDEYKDTFTRNKKYIIDHISRDSIYVEKDNNGMMMGCDAHRWKPLAYECKHSCKDCKGKCDLWEKD